MKWFKHDANALQDAKIERLLMRHGIAGYGLYFAVVELIASRVTATCFDFRLEHDCELLAYRLRLKTTEIETILNDCVELQLLERDAEGFITCTKLAERLDNTMTQNPELRKALDLFSDKTEATQPAKQEPQIPYNEIVELYHSCCPVLPKVKVLSDKRKKMIRCRWLSNKKHQTLDFWKKYFSHAASSPFLNGTNERKWMADLEWLVNETNFIKVIEGKYHAR